MVLRFLDPRYGTLGRLDYFLFKYVYLTIISFLLVLLIVLPPILFRLDFFLPDYLFFAAIIALSYLSLLFDIRRLKDIGWSLWLLCIPLFPLVFIALMWLVPELFFQAFETMDKSRRLTINIILTLNVSAIIFSALLLFIKGKTKSAEILEAEYEEEIRLAEERFKSGGQNT